jgi:hypothetical protein|tara:strand:+ start:4709 stop:4924 length:216 start_codon:yes stop_codon:yes gene_type:complete
MSSFDTSSLAKMVLVKFLTIANIHFLPVGIALRRNTDAAITSLLTLIKQYLCHHNKGMNINTLLKIMAQVR